MANSTWFPMGASEEDWLKWQAWEIQDWPRLHPERRVKPKSQYEEFKTMRTFTIELRADFSDEEKFELIKAAAKVAAKHLFTTALLLQDKRKPQISLYGSDFFSSAEEISLADDIPQDDGGNEEESEDAPADQDSGAAK